MTNKLIVFNNFRTKYMIFRITETSYLPPVIFLGMKCLSWIIYYKHG